MKEYPFYTAYTQAMDLYSLELTPDEFENIGIIAWNKIGNKKHRLYRFQTEPVQDSSGAYYVDLPCNCDQIEAVTTNYEDYQKTTPIDLAGNNTSGWIEGYIESRKYNTNHLYPSGKYIKYTQEGNRIYLADKFAVVNILYKGFLADESGLPSLNDREIDAISSFCIYTDMFKKAIVTRDNSTFQMAQVLEQQWKTKCTQARVPDYLNQNEMDEILNTISSWDRKRFGKSFKPIR
jgi:hypothetical protein